METNIRNKCKAYTSLEQSKKLAEILPIESADMFWAPDVNIIVAEPYITKTENETLIPAYDGAIPAWSLAALLGLMPRIEHLKPFIDLSPKLDSEEVAIYYHSEDSPYIVRDNLVDACVEMILKLNK